VSAEAAIARKLRLWFPADRWVLVRHAATHTGPREKGTHIGDVFAVAFWPSMAGQIEMVEIKDRADDFDSEMGDEEKGSAFDPYLSRRWIAVSSPWQRVVRSKDRIRQPWGLLSCGTGKPRRIVPAVKLKPSERLSPFALSLLVAAQAAAEASAATGDAPMVEVSRPHASRTHAILACFHAVPSLAKTVPPKLPCPGCRDGRPTDEQAIEAAIRDADRDQLDRLAAMIAARRAA
jgi:hypothetical protein